MRVTLLAFSAHIWYCYDMEGGEKEVKHEMKKLSLVMGILILATGLAQAGTVTTSNVPPTVDGKDVAMLELAGSGGQGKFWEGEGFAAGQTFTTDRGTGAHLLNAVTIRYHGTYDPGNQATEFDPTKTYGVRIVTLSGTAITELHDEEFVHSAAVRAGDYLTFEFNLPFVLSPQTVYGFDVRMKRSTTSYSTGIPTVTWNSDLYGGGEYYVCSQWTDGDKNGWSATDLALASPNSSRDWVFHLDIDYQAAGTVLILK